MRIFCTVVFVSLCLNSGLRAQPPEFSQPEKEHEVLKQFVGQWKTTSKSVSTGEQPELVQSGTIESRMLGGFWVINEAKAEIAEMKYTAIQTIGYDTSKKKYIGTWIDSMLNHLWHYEGEFDAAEKTLHLVAEGPDLTSPGKTATYRDSYEFKSKDLIIATSEMKNEAGEWVTFMTGKLVRIKK